MNKSYELSDGSLSTDYEAGDTFILLEGSGADPAGTVITCKEHQGDRLLYKHGYVVALWSWVKPTEETKIKSGLRKLKKCLADYEDKNNPQPLARIVDWRGGESVEETDVVLHLSDEGNIIFITSGNFFELHLDANPESVVIRLNNDLIPKQRVMTKAEAELKFGVRIKD